MNRRAMLLSAGALALPARAAAQAIPRSGRMHFRVLRNGSPIGEHLMQFSASAGKLNISTIGRLLVTFAGIPIFRYSVQAMEYWENGQFQAVDSAVNFNGTPLEVHAEQVKGGYRVQGTRVPPYLAPENLLPLTYWNKAMMDATILNIQTAHCYPVTVNSPGWKALPTANGGTIIARRYNLTGKLRMSIWYDQGGSWSGLEFHKSGDIRYEKYV